MTTTQSTSDAMPIVDTQTHWYSRTLWDAYLTTDTFPRCRRDGDDYLYELAPDRWFPIRRNFYDLDAQFEVFDAAGIQTIISSSASFGDVDRLPADQAIEISYALNEERADAQRKYPGRFFGLATLPWGSPTAVLDVLGSAARLGLPGVLMHSNIAGAPVDSEQLRAIYHRIAELDLVLSLHPARTVMERELRDYGLEYLVGFMFDTSVAALRLTLSGIVSEVPELRIIHPHCGATLPYLAGRIDDSHDKPYSLGKQMSPLPSVQLAGFYTDTVCQSEETLVFAERFYADGHLMFGSDFPYFSPDRELAFVRGALRDPRAVLCDNAVQAFRLSTACTPAEAGPGHA
jgi:aminocarboxymuconate-semialdehyde decarboxylase